MPRYIDADAAGRYLVEKLGFLAPPQKMEDILDVLADFTEENSADAAPVVHGEWIVDNKTTPKCSRCGTANGIQKNKYVPKKQFPSFCPNCGAIMDNQQPPQAYSFTPCFRGATPRIELLRVFRRSRQIMAEIPRKQGM